LTEIQPERAEGIYLRFRRQPIHRLYQRDWDHEYWPLPPPGRGSNPGTKPIPDLWSDVALEKTDWILENHHPEPLSDNQQKELTKIIQAAEKELSDKE
jgi:hypothetical protein